nr:tRNA uridine-5-carboxymethylaminomethyl(34) synthesis enzyme MnmG [Sphingomonas montana]
MDQAYDVVVIGGGHAGCEAAAAAARSGARVALVTMQADRIGAMSCNPAIGGIGKGHIVREVDAWDGIMGRAADAAAIHYRMLNRSKGVAVQGPRVQADRVRYAAVVRAALAAYPTLSIVEAEVDDLTRTADRITGVRTSAGLLHAGAVVIAAGTFLGGILHSGLTATTGGRVGERAATRLGRHLRDLGLPVARLKTGTPPRLDGRTIDWARLDRQASDTEVWTMSPDSSTPRLPQIHCAVTRTNLATHDVIRGALDVSPLFSGRITGSGPRYCPSIEDKVFRFGDRDGHQIFLEPEGLDTRAVYPNGISTSLPPAIQQDFLRTIAGLEQVAILEAGYAVEYDYVDPRALDTRLAVTGLTGLFLAGQINGTTGYEEAAGQGLVAGLNAAAHARGRDAVSFDRADSYIGVMVDDLTLQGVTEPYRMLTARADNRLHLRADNAEARLGEQAVAAGAVRAPKRQALDRRRAAHRATRAAIDTAMLHPPTAATLRQSFSEGHARDTVNSLVPATQAQDATIVTEVIADLLYAPYVERQRADAKRLLGGANLPLDTVDYATIGGLSAEMVERLRMAAPADLQAAARIRGITPAALTAILVQARRAPTTPRRAA